MNKYFGDFDSDTNICHEWNLNESDGAPTDAEVLAAYYAYEDYSGTAFVLYQRDGKLFEVNDGHCSCNGLDRWVPEETTWAALAERDFGGYSFHSDFTAFMKELISQHV